jgi:hypothetical protein
MGGSPMADEEARLPEEVFAAAEEVFSPEDEAAEASVIAEMNTMYQRDRLMAIIFVVLLLIVIPFTVIALWRVMPDPATKVTLILAGAVLILFNVASMLALVQNYQRDKEFIYRRDVAHLRELKVARRIESEGGASR